MRKKSIILLFLIIICVSFNSCFIDVPRTSDNFDRDFYDSFGEKYSIKDPNLLYMTAAPYEVKTKSNILISLIYGVDKNMFVAGTKVSNFYGISYDYPYVYQTEDAPTPMKDWTIKNIYLTRCIDLNYRLPNGDNPSEIIENLMQRYLETNEILKVYSKDSESNSRFISSMQETYLNANLRYPVLIPLITDYILLFTFEECPNIVWITKLLWQNGYFFIEIEPFSATQNSCYGLISNESGEMIRQTLILHGWIEPEYTPGPPPSLPEPETSSNLPIEEIVPEND